MKKPVNGESPTKEGKKRSFWYGITNPKWIPLKALYFASSCGVASLQPFIVPFYKSLGLTAQQIGIFEFIHVLVGMIANPFVGIIADKTRRHGLVLGICTIGFLIPTAAMGLFVGPSQEAQHSARLIPNKSTTTYEVEICGFRTVERLSNTTSWSVSAEAKQAGSKKNPVPQLICPNWQLLSNSSAIPTLLGVTSQNCSIFGLQIQNQIQSESLNCYFNFPIEPEQWTFAWICGLRSLSALFAACMTLTDSVACAMLGRENRRLWGQQRMFATIAVSLTAGLMGVAVNHFQTYRICFVTFAILKLAAAMIAIFWVPRRLDQVGKGNKEQERVPFVKALKAVLLEPISSIIFVAAIAAGMFLSVNQVVWPQHIVDLGAPKLFFGIKAAVIALLEIPGFFFSGTVVSRIGETACYLIMFLAYSIRYTANAFLTPETVWLALPVEGLHVVCFTLYVSARTSLITIISPPGTLATAQAMLSTGFGTGRASGILLASFIYQTYGRYIAFLAYAVFAFCSFLVLLLVYLVYLRRAMARLTQRADSENPAEEGKNQNEEIAKLNDPLKSVETTEL